MTTEAPNADQVADLLLPLDGPYHPDRVIEAARTVAELVRRLGHATFHASALRYPPQLYRSVAALRSGLHGLEQTFGQLATRLDTFTADGLVEHDNGDDPWVACADAAQHLRLAAAELGAVTGPLDRASAITSHLGYDTSPPRARRPPFPPPRTPTAVHEGRSPTARPAPAGDRTSTTTPQARPQGGTDDRTDRCSRPSPWRPTSGCATVRSGPGRSSPHPHST